MINLLKLKLFKPLEGSIVPKIHSKEESDIKQYFKVTWVVSQHRKFLQSRCSRYVFYNYKSGNSRSRTDKNYIINISLVEWLTLLEDILHKQQQSIVI